jgi:phenolic acid decarboxylase
VIELESFESTKPEELIGFIGKHVIYTYENGWQYEIYIKNATRVDYRIHSGIVGGRWVRDQKAHIVRLASGIYKVSWDEPTGTCVSLAFMLESRITHGTAFFPNWIAQEPEKTVCYQNEHLEQMHAYRDAGPTHPKFILDEFSAITFMEDCGADNESVIACAPSELPAGYANRRN